MGKTTLAKALAETMKDKNNQEQGVVLINPPSQKSIDKWDNPKWPHLGLAYIASILLKNNIRPIIIDAKFEKINLNEVKTRISNLERIDIVGLTSMTHNIKDAHATAKIIKDIFPESLTVIGGCHVTALPKQTLEEFPFFDVVVIGEGEITFYEIVKAVKEKTNFEKIEGIAFRRDNEIYLTKPREFIDNLDLIPFPAWQLFPKSERYPIMASRGCPSKCNFCMRVMGNRVRKRTPQNIINEMLEDITKFNAKHIPFFDESFTANKKNCFTLLELMMKKKINTKVTWSVETRVDFINKEILLKMKSAGCVWVGFGIESGNQGILKRTGQGITKEQAVEAINQAKSAGIRVGSFFIFGHPFETYESAMDTIKFATQLNTDTVAFGIMVPYPGTEIFKMALSGEGGYKIISSDWSDFDKTLGNSLELETLSRKDLEILQLRGYLQVYLLNYRFFEFLNFFIKNKKVVISALKKILKHY